jgi:hypothetical protein
MTTDDLIATLARSPEPVKTNKLGQKLMIAVIAGLILGLLLLKYTLGFRPDIGVAAPIVAMKAGLSALIATFAGGLAITLSKPIVGGSETVKRAGGPLVTLVFAALAIGAISLFSTDPAHRFVAFTGGSFPWCIVIIPMCGLPTASLVMWILKDAAPTRLVMAGAGVGALSGGVGAVVYSMFCPVDSVAFVTIWYVAGIAISSVLGALAGIRLLRW